MGRWNALRPLIRPMPPARLLMTAVFTASLRSLSPADAPPDEIHEVLKAKFIPKRLAIADGNGEIRDELVIGGSSAKLNKLEFGEFCESARRWAAEDLGVVIPDPETGHLWGNSGPRLS